MRMPRPLTAARFVRRDNRFRVVAEADGQLVMAHLPNSGRLGELLTPGRELRLAPMPNRRRKTPFDLKLVRYAGVWVSVDARLPNHLFVEAFGARALPHLSGYTHLRSEVSLGHSRIDFLLNGPAGRCWVETKSVTLVEEGIARFPDAPTERGCRHLTALGREVARGDQAAILFVVQRPDARAFGPHVKADPDFAQALRQALAAGVAVLAYRCHVSEHEISLDSSISIEWGSNEARVRGD